MSRIRVHTDPAPEIEKGKPRTLPMRSLFRSFVMLENGRGPTQDQELLEGKYQGSEYGPVADIDRLARRCVDDE